MTVQPLKSVDPWHPGSDFDEFYRRVQPRLLAYATASFHEVDPEEVVAETMARALEHFGLLHPRKDAFPWLVVVARRIACDAYRAQSACPATKDEAFAALPGRPNLRPEDVVVSREQVQLFERTLGGMSESYARLLRLRYEDGLSHEQIALLVGSTTDAVRTQFRRARRRFIAGFAARGGDLPGVLPIPLLVWLGRRLRASRSHPARLPVPVLGALSACVMVPLGLALLAPVLPFAPDGGPDTVPIEQLEVSAARHAWIPPVPVLQAHRGTSDPSPAVAVDTGLGPVSARVWVGKKPFAPGKTQEHRIAVESPVGTLYLEGGSAGHGPNRLVCQVSGVDCT